MIDRTLSADELPAAIWSAGRRARLAPTTATERAALADVVAGLLSPRPDLERLAIAAEVAGMRIERWQVGGESFAALVERSAGGRGAYLFRLDGGDGVLLQAPHAYHDLGTGELAAEIFFSPGDGPRPRALFTNTIHRYQDDDGQRRRRPDSPADVCHNPDHPFSAATEAAVRAMPDVRIVQLHGFGDGDLVRDGVDVVVSAGRQRPTATSERVAEALRGVLAGQVLLYPTQVDRLGGTTNVQASIARAHGADFLHLELGPAAREALRDPARRRAFATVAATATP